MKVLILSKMQINLLIQQTFKEYLLCAEHHSSCWGYNGE